MESRMTARRISLFAALVTMSVAGWYVAVYLARWEWNRALMAGVIFVAAEIALLGVLVLDRIARLERRERASPQGEGDARGVGSRQRRVDPRVLTRLHEASPPPRKPFAWLSPSSDQMSVFVPVLLGAGVLLSGAAWVVERVAGHIRAGIFDRRLAGRLHTLALPAGGLLGENEDDPFRPAS